MRAAIAAGDRTKLVSLLGRAKEARDAVDAGHPAPTATRSAGARFATARRPRRDRPPTP
jgi:2-keto-3-deoxy-L-rhamnonate aldolase RhmA